MAAAGAVEAWLEVASVAVIAGGWASPLVQIELSVQAAKIWPSTWPPRTPAVLRGLIDEEIARCVASTNAAGATVTSPGRLGADAGPAAGFVFFVCGIMWP